MYFFLASFRGSFIVGHSSAWALDEEGDVILPQLELLDVSLILLLSTDLNRTLEKIQLVHSKKRNQVSLFFIDVLFKLRNFESN